MSGHARERAAWFVAALASVTAGMAPAGALPGPLAALVLTLSLGIVPGALLVRALAPDEAGDARAATALLLSPCLGGGGMVLLRLAGVGVAPATRALALALALASAWKALRPGGRVAAAASDRGVWLLAVAAGAGLALAHTLSPALSARSDGSFHAGVVWAAARALPPEDPFFAGLTLRYFWGLHAWAAGWVAVAPALGAYAPLVVSNALAAVSALLAVGALARGLGATPRTRWLAQALALAGTAPFVWLVLAARAGSGAVRGGAEVAGALGHGADAALRALDPGLLHPSLVIPLDKFVVLTPFAWGLAGAAVLALALVRALAEPGWRASLGLALVVAATVFVHPVAGLALAVAALAGAAWTAFAYPLTRRGLPGLALSLGFGLAAMVPYLRAISGGPTARSGAALAWRLGFDPRGFASVLVAGAFLMPQALWPDSARRTREPGRSAVTGMLVTLVLATCLLRVPGDNQSKFLNLAFLLASAPAALAWARAAASTRTRAAVGALLAAAFVPTLAAVVWSYAHESGSSTDAPSRPPNGIVSAVRQLVPSDAVLVDATLDITRGAAPALPGETGRTLLWSGGFMARKWGYAAQALDLREAAASALGRGRTPVGPESAFLRSLERQVWVIASDDSARAANSNFQVAARTDGVVLARFVAH
jgi:hypothetical protein